MTRKNNKIQVYPIDHELKKDNMIQTVTELFNQLETADMVTYY